MRLKFELKHNDENPKKAKRMRTGISTFALCVFVLIAMSILLNNNGNSRKRVDSPPQGTTIGKEEKGHIYHGPKFPELKGKAYHIFEPMSNGDTNTPSLLSSPEVWIPSLMEHFVWVDGLTTGGDQGRTTKERARAAYLEVLRNQVSGQSYGNEEQAVAPGTGRRQVRPKNDRTRDGGEDWPLLGVTMTGTKRLANVRELIEDVVEKGIEGDYIETGVWRGGSSIFARGVLRSLGQGSTRRSFVCDSFAGLPPGDRNLDKQDTTMWSAMSYLPVPERYVQKHFEQLSLLDDGVVFAKGFFNETMPVLGQHIKKLAIMRLDGDMYESTVDVLYHLYDKLSIGGYVIMDDWDGFPSKTACLDFFKTHGFQPEMIQIDKIAAYWQKTQETEIQYWRYKQNKFVD